LTCNPFNEGCNGGWPILTGYFLEDFYLPLESCAPYEASTKGSKCPLYQECPKAVSVEKAFYIGGFYGNGNEESMMKEIICRGPIVADLEVPLSFSYYRSGIFS